MKNKILYTKINNHNFMKKNKKTEFSFKKTTFYNICLINALFHYFIIIFIIDQILADTQNFISITMKSAGNFVINRPNINAYIICNQANCDCSDINKFECSIDESNKNLDITFLNDNDMKDFSEFFKNNYLIEAINFNNLIHEGITNVRGMFENCINLVSINFNNLKATHIVDMSRMFYNCTSLNSVSFGSNFIAPSSLVHMEYMFSRFK